MIADEVTLVHSPPVQTYENGMPCDTITSYTHTSGNNVQTTE
jgi:hypothetical protein